MTHHHPLMPCIKGFSSSVGRLLTPEAIGDKVAGVHANPVAAGAVRYAKDWPGLCSTVRDLGAETPIVRPTPPHALRTRSSPSQ